MKDYCEYKVGDSAWIYLSGYREGEMTKGEVVAVLDLPTHGRQYVIAINTGMDDLLEVRSGHFLSMRPKDPRVDRIADIIKNGRDAGSSDGMIARDVLFEIGE